MSGVFFVAFVWKLSSANQDDQSQSENSPQVKVMPVVQ